MMCKQGVNGASELKIIQGKKILHELDLSAPLTSDPLPIARGNLLITREEPSETESGVAPVLDLKIPESGKRFVLVLFPAPGGKREQPYLYRLIRTDDQRFGVSDLYLSNLTSLQIGGLLGTAKFNLSPNASEIVTPLPAPSGARVYQSRFYFQFEGKARIFNDTRWPISRSARIYLFFVPDPNRNSVGYLSFREYAPFP
ncbi:hypothetical protein [Haloferula rosea]|uniref:Uncharacterized protein n=1 Tax=Haloferula rosea TaxID=490093 RepID=A0A934R8A8_9BACT|nr:hypothetical protein [Haloferula rosea]MBK1825803.1 hypothetical protein [Haloferula rosea]